VALYKQFPLTGGPYLRHLGFLGAAPPAVKGLAPVRFVDSEFHEIDAGSYPLALNSSLPEALMPEPKSKLENFMDYLRNFFLPDTPNPTATHAGGDPRILAGPSPRRLCRAPGGARATARRGGGTKAAAEQS
jgi:hypothetical protein